MCNIRSMGDLDTRKHDVDVIERVVGGVRDRVGDAPTHVVAVHTTHDNGHSTVELTIGLGDDEEPRRQEPSRPRRDGRRR